MNNIKPKISLMVTSFNRPQILYESLKYIFRAQMINICNLVIVQQDTNSEFNQIFKKIDHKNFYLIKTSYPDYFDPHKKIILNGKKGMEFCFEKLKSDMCFYLEDDIAIAYDFINFGCYIIKKYENNNNFFAFNAFSAELLNLRKINLYSKFIYGVGKGWGISKKRWIVVKKLWNKKFIDSSAGPLFEAPIEAYIKKNNLFVVMPINSRSYEIPSDGVNIKLKINSDYFKILKNSFVKKKYKNLDYRYTFFSNYKWRQDCKKYKGQLIHLFYDMILKFFKKIYSTLK